MSQDADIQTRIAETLALMRDKLGVRDKTLTESVKRAKRRLPRPIYKQALFLAKAETIADHPKLRLILDTPVLVQASDNVQAHLKAINLADRRMGLFLSMLGSFAFGVLVLFAFAILVLRWRGYI